MCLGDRQTRVKVLAGLGSWALAEGGGKDLLVEGLRF